MNAQARTRVGVIGAGNIGTIEQLPTLAKRDDVELAATRALPLRSRTAEATLGRRRRVRDGQRQRPRPGVVDDREAQVSHASRVITQPAGGLPS